MKYRVLRTFTISTLVLGGSLVGCGRSQGPDSRPMTSVDKRDTTVAHCGQPPNSYVQVQDSLSFEAQIPKLESILALRKSKTEKYQQLRTELPFLQSAEAWEYRLCLALESGRISRETYERFINSITDLFRSSSTQSHPPPDVGEKIVIESRQPIESVVVNFRRDDSSKANIASRVAEERNPPGPNSLSTRIGYLNFRFGTAEIAGADPIPLLEQVVTYMNQNPDVKVKVIGYVDNIGSEELNLALTERRAQAVKDYLIRKGIDAGRLETEGRGENDPIDSNDTDLGRARNRRVEFYVIGNLSGYEPLAGISINFKFGTAEISGADPIPLLADLTSWMKRRPELCVRIVVHTDAIGAVEYSQDLSWRRASAVKEYLVKSGIEATRITTEGKGSAEPIASNDTDLGRALNRRVEFVAVNCR